MDITVGIGLYAFGIPLRMRMVFFVSGLTCQECADKLEAHIQRQKGVNGAALMVTGKFVIDCEDEYADAIAEEVLTSAPKAQGEVKAKRIQ
jgi:copper chaperone CopZ